MDHKEQQLASPAGHDASVVAQLEEKVAHYIKQVKELEAKVGRALITFYTRSNKQASPGVCLDVFYNEIH